MDKIYIKIINDKCVAFLDEIENPELIVSLEEWKANGFNAYISDDGKIVLGKLSPTREEVIEKRAQSYAALVDKKTLEYYRKLLQEYPQEELAVLKVQIDELVKKIKQENPIPGEK